MKIDSELKFQKAINSLYHSSGARPELLMCYEAEKGYTLIGCNRPSALLFDTPERLPSETPLAWNDIPHVLAKYLAEALSQLVGATEETLPPFISPNDQRRFGVRLFASMETDESGQPSRQLYLICFDEALDWSESHHQEFESRKMETIGQLASGVAHDFNNVMMGIQANAEALLNNGPDRQARGAIDNILRACTTGSSLTRSLLGYAKRQPLNMSKFNLAEMVNDVRSIASLSLAAAHPIVCDDNLSKNAEPIYVHGCYSSLSHCLLNLIKNAREAMEDGGRVLISWSGDDETARLSVTDQGMGIPESDLARIFEPFYSTKSQGTGMGLAMVKGILNQHGGTIQINSRVGGGTTVQLIWPRWRSEKLDGDESRVVPMEERGKPIGQQTHGTLAYVIDDDELVRGGLQGLLEHLGYQVKNFGDAESALEMLRQSVLPKLVLVDFHMPGMDGSEFIQQWFGSIAEKRRAALETKIVLVSGHPPSKFQDMAARYPEMDVSFLQKPFSMETLHNCITKERSVRSITMRIKADNLASAVRAKPKRAAGSSS